MFKKITIIGMGLIGSSLAHAIRKNNVAEKIIAADKDPKVCRIVTELGIADASLSNIQQSVIGSDLVVIATPVGAFEDVAQEIGPMLKPGAIITDAGSVKQSVVEALTPYIPDSVHFIPAHPIAGTEYSGPRAGFSELFEGRWCILTPLPDSDLKAVEKATEFWEGCGARIELMDPKQHDMVLGITSHLPHLIAYTIVGTANELEDETKADVIKYSASGFRGFTRIAASDPTMWRDVFLNNSESILEILQRFTEDLTAMQKAIRRGDATYIFETLSHVRGIRKNILELGEEGLPAPRQKIMDSQGQVTQAADE